MLIRTTGNEMDIEREWNGGGREVVDLKADHCCLIITSHQRHTNVTENKIRQYT